MVASIFIFFYFSLKLILAEVLNEANFSFPLNNTEGKRTIAECADIISSLINSEDKPKEQIYEATLCVLELIRDDPAVAEGLISIIKIIVIPNLPEILIQNNMSFLTNLTDEVFGKNSKFFDDLIDIIKNHPEFCDYSITLVKSLQEGKNITQSDLLIYIYNMTNIDGMDKVIGHIINSTHNIALFKLVEVKFINGTKYAELYESLKEGVIYPHKDEILQLIYKIIKSGILIPGYEPKDKIIIIDIINMLQKLINSIKPYVIENLNDILSQNNATFLYNFTMEILNSTFFDDLFTIIKNNSEILNYSAILLKAVIEGRNLFDKEILILINKILNVNGIDEIFNRIINSTYNDAILKLIDIKILNGTRYAIINETFYSYRTPIFRLIYKILKEGVYISENEINKNVTIYILEFIKDNPEIPRKIFHVLKLYINDNKENLEIFLNQTNMSFLYNLTEEIVNSTFLEDLSDVIEKHPELINYTLILVNGINNNNITKRKFIENLQKMVNIKEFREVISPILKKYFYDLLNFYPQKVGQKGTVFDLLIELKDFIKKYQSIIVDLILDIISHYLEYINILKDIEHFILVRSKGTDLLDRLRLIFTNQTMVKKISPLINFYNEMSNTIVRSAIAEKDLMDLFFDLIKNPTYVESVVNIVSNIKNETYLDKHFQNFMNETIRGNSTVKRIIINSFSNIIRNTLTEDRLKNYLSGFLSNLLLRLNENVENNLNFNISTSCAALIDHTYLHPPENNTFRFFYTKKFLFDSTKSKNDFLTYENCLNGFEKSNYSTAFQIKPVYVVAKIIDRFNQSKLKNSSYYDKYNYMISFCFPQGKNSETDKDLCSNDDYAKLIGIINSFTNNMVYANITVFSLSEKDLKGEPKIFAYFVLIIIISAIPLFIWIFLIIYKNIKLFNLQKNEINNKLIKEKENKNQKIIQTNQIRKREYSIRKIAPKWYRYLNEYFNLSKNGSELFNFTLNQTIFNDFNGITYIKGILGISMILNILGVTFLIVVNSLTKILGSYQFYETLFSPVYIFAFIGLRYSPRIIFSCSGYTLIYKFLNFIESDSNFCFFKFLILQSYKFILLILASIYLRFCVYYIDTIFLNIRNPTSESFNKELIQHNGGYFFNLISFLFYNIKDEDEIFAKETAFIPYLYLPINEIILFIIGIAIISLGYKFKLRFDLIIIISFILIYLFKLILFVAHLYKKQFFSTLYFFLYGYGILMLNPIFNLPSFLVGMYFGLVNFTIQRGINDINEDEKNNNEYELLEKEKISHLYENKDEEIYKMDTNNNLINNNLEKDKTYRTLTFIKGRSFTFKKNKTLFDDENKKSFYEEYTKTKKTLDINIPIETNDILVEMPFLKSTVDFKNFHRKNQDKKLLKIILAMFIILTLFFIFVRYIFIHNIIEKEITKSEESSSDKNGVKRITDILSLEDLIPNLFLNILYVIDIEIVVIMINWIFFYLYFKGGQINDFLSHIYWSFFIKSYFSYSLVSSLVILYIIYQSETIIKVNLYTLFFYSLISSFFIFIATIIFYSCYEYPLRKIFKTIKRAYINLDDEEFYEEENENENEIISLK